jgi:hypothetical protein
MQITNKLGFGGALVFAALMGCGSSGGGGGTGGGGGRSGSGSGGSSGGFTTSVPAGTKLTSLTSQQATQLCTDINNYGTNALAPDLCKLIAIESTALTLLSSSTAQPSNAMLQAACTQAYDACLSGDGGLTTTSNCDPSTFTSEPSTCTATVGDLTMCANADLTTTNQELAQLPSCSSVTATNLVSALATLEAEADAGTSTSATCTALESNCNTGSSPPSTVGLVTAARRLRK